MCFPFRLCREEEEGKGEGGEAGNLGTDSSYFDVSWYTDLHRPPGNNTHILFVPPSRESRASQSHFLKVSHVSAEVPWAGASTASPVPSFDFLCVGAKAGHHGYRGHHRWSNLPFILCKMMYQQALDRQPSWGHQLKGPQRANLKEYVARQQDPPMSITKLFNLITVWET